MEMRWPLRCRAGMSSDLLNPNDVVWFEEKGSRFLCHGVPELPWVEVIVGQFKRPEENN
ncbi:hypothetical protein PIB30_085323, partial [Stylosanthes scabra]|nr:hypothetical protein [Stylosanthes scabra]